MFSWPVKGKRKISGLNECMDALGWGTLSQSQSRSGVAVGLEFVSFGPATEYGIL